MRGVRIPHDLNGEDQFILGLSVPRLAALFFGLLAAYTILHVSLPAPLQLGGAAIAALCGATLAFVRPAGRSMIHWVGAAIEFKLESDRQGQVDINPSKRPRLTVIARPSSMAPAGDPPVGKGPDSASQLSAPPGDIDGGLDGDVIDLPDTPTTVLGDADIADQLARPAPVYLGGPQVICFYSPKGGTGRTTLATESAALLAMKGRYRESPGASSQPLRVVLIDFDLGSANVSARLGLAQPTMLDYVCNASTLNPDPVEYVLRHPATNLDVLLGPSKCLAGDRADLLGVPQAAHILTTLKSAGYQFLILDMGASLGDLETYLLEAATRIYCVVTPTAGSVQSLYRGVEALRRLGLGAKLQYVANKMRDGLNLSEPMSDLKGSLVARIPYDVAFDTAENRHEPMVTRGAGGSVEALEHLAASIYPALEAPVTARPTIPPFAWFARRRRAG